MDVQKLIGELRQEHDLLCEAIVAIERLRAGGKRRGRPPAWLAAMQTEGPKRRGRPPKGETKEE